MCFFLPTMTKLETVMVMCSCCAESVVLTSDDPGEHCPCIYLSLWAYKSWGNKDANGIWERIKWSWTILTTGTPWRDEIVLDLESAQKLSDALKKRVELLSEKQK